MKEVSYISFGILAFKWINNNNLFSQMQWQPQIQKDENGERVYNSILSGQWFEKVYFNAPVNQYGEKPNILVLLPSSSVK